MSHTEFTESHRLFQCILCKSVCYKPQPGSKYLTQIKQIEQIKILPNLCKPRSARDQPMVQAECRERACSSYAEATPIDAERKREPEGQAQRAQQSVCYTPTRQKKLHTDHHRLSQIISVYSVYSVCDTPQPGSKSLTQIKQMEQIKILPNL